MHRIALGLEYDGAPFSGWQIQSSSELETLQGKVEEALSKVANQPIKTFCAGRRLGKQRRRCWSCARSMITEVCAGNFY